MCGQNPRLAQFDSPITHKKVTSRIARIKKNLAFYHYTKPIENLSIYQNNYCFK